MNKPCPDCGDKYERIGQHWSMGSCDHPPFTNRQREIITGLLMSDGNIGRGSKNPYIRASMITEKFLKWLDDEMSIFGNGVSPSKSAEENAQDHRNTGFNPNASVENYNDVYCWRSVRHPELHEFAEWYETGRKVWPESIELTPLSLKVFFCGDGHFKNTGGDRYISFALSNERKNKKKVEKLFGAIGLSGQWMESTRRDGSIVCGYVLDVEQSQKAFNIMGDPLPGFEYKWPDE